MASFSSPVELHESDYEFVIESDTCDELSDVDDDEEDFEKASLEHLSEGEDELSELRKGVKFPGVQVTRILTSENVDNPKEGDEHELYLRDLYQSLQMEEFDGTDKDISEDMKGPIHDPTTHWKLMKPKLGERYASPYELRECIIHYGLAHGYPIWFEKIDHGHVLAKCGSKKKGEDGIQVCPWRLWGTWVTGEKTFKVKTLIDKHTCARNFKFSSLVTYKVIAKMFGNKIRGNPNIKVKELQAAWLKKFKCQITQNQARRAKNYALNEIEEGLKEHYEKLWSYGEEINRTNPGSTVKISVDVNPDGKTYFQSFYVCFNGLKEGWLKGCRKVIGLDGCFLKTVVKGELLSAVGRDGNNQIYPIAWAVVAVENKENWSWFIKLLNDDLQLNEGAGITLISDQHKGLIEAVKDVLPWAEHRQCARHIYANFRKSFSGLQLQNLFWSASKASYPQQFEEVMEAIKLQNPQAYEYLMGKQPHTWSRAFFKTDKGCDAVENGISECFNSLILDARKQPIITMLEAIRIIIMERMEKMRNNVRRWDHDICPAIRKKLEHLKELQRFWHVIPSGGDLFEVKKGKEAFVVNEQKMTCTCRMWQLSGLPCTHAIATIFFINKAPETYVPSWFKKSMFVEAYNNYVNPLNGMKMWPPTTYIDPLPPKPRRMPGRPKLKRRRHASEGSQRRKTKISKEGGSSTCQSCLQKGHNIRTCVNAKKDPPVKINKQKKASLPTQASQTGQPLQHTESTCEQVIRRPKLVPWSIKKQ